MFKKVKLEEIDFSKYVVDPENGIYSKFFKKWLTGWIIEDECGRKDRAIKLRTINNTSKDYMYSRVMAYLFVERPEHLKEIPYEFLEVDHIDTDSLNNTVYPPEKCNLRWCTPSENASNPLTLKHHSEVMKGKPFTEEHRRKIKESLTGIKRTHETIQKLKNREITPEWRKKLSDTKPKKACRCLEIGTGKILGEFESISEAARQTGIPKSSIKDCLNGKLKTAGKRLWERA